MVILFCARVAEVGRTALRLLPGLRPAGESYCGRHRQKHDYDHVAGFHGPLDVQPEEPDEVLQGILLPGGKQVPFCSYNAVGYREQARAQLEAMEPERRRARREGTPYVPRPVVFNMNKRSEWVLTEIALGQTHE